MRRWGQRSDLPPAPTGDSVRPPPLTPARRSWSRDTARPPQLTLRATCLGLLLGLVTGVSNLYIGLKTGLALGVVVTASALGWALWSALLRLGLARRRLHVLEASSMATTASAAGYSSGALLTSSIGALAMISGGATPWWRLSLWITTVALLGALLAVALRRSLVEVEALPFPGGIAAAETLRGLAGDADDADDPSRARALWLALGFAAGLKWLTAGMPIVAGWGLPSQWPTPAMVAGSAWLAAPVAYTWSLELGAAVAGTGALIGWHMCWSVLLGALLCFGVLAPLAHAEGLIAAADYGAIAQWSVWPGLAWMIVGGVAPLLRARRSIAAGLGELRQALGPFGRLGVAAVACTCVILQRLWFEVPLAVAALAVLLALVLATITARVAGETDVVLTGPFAKIAQVSCGSLLPGAPGPALIGASVAAGAGNACAALLADFKAGRLLGAEPRRLLAAHLVGALLGGLVLVPVCTQVLVPDPAALGTATWPAPAAQAWRSLAIALAGGWQPEPVLVAAIGVAALLGALLVALSRRPRLAPWLPHPLGLGLGFVLPAHQSAMFFLGGLVALVVARQAPAISQRYALVVACGLIAGESLVGVLVALLAARG